MPAPAAHDRVDPPGHHLFILDDQVPTDREVVERLGRLRDRDVEAGEVAAGVAAVSRQAHGSTVVRSAAGTRSWGSAATAPGGPEGRRLDAVEELALLGGELLLGDDAALAEVVELDEPVADLEGDRTGGWDATFGGRTGIGGRSVGCG